MTTKTQITFVLDASGSMSRIEADTIGGFNSFLDDQRSERGTATVSLFEFDTTVESVYEGRPIEQAPELADETYSPSGQTALHDAIVTAIESTWTHIGRTAGESRPDNVVLVVLTDGKENASETPQAITRDLVEECREKGWEFLFIGANQDAALSAGEVGIDPDHSLEMAHSGDGARAAYDSTSEQVRQVRQDGFSGGYDEADRRRQEDAK